MHILLSLVIFFFAVVVHECAHGWCAYKLGDPTAKYAGRLTLNPLAHIDPFGTVLLPIMLIVMQSPFIFGWAKPVPINFRNLRDPRRDMLLVGLSGPLSNFILAFLISLLIKSGAVSYSIIPVLQLAIIINLVLAVFNLIPIPPLDGSRILMGILPRNLTYLLISFERYGFVILFIFIWLGMFNHIIWPIVKALFKILGV